MFRQLLVCGGLPRRNTPGGSDELGGEEFKLPEMTSLVIIITFNMLLQVRGFAVLACSSVA